MRPPGRPQQHGGPRHPPGLRTRGPRPALSLAPPGPPSHSHQLGPWPDGFYSRLVIRVATREGFAHPFSTEEGGNQGDGFAQLHYQAPSLVITRAMRPNTSITLPLTVPGHSASLPATHLSYSDDRRFITPSLTDVAAMATDYRECSRRAGRIIHPDKQEFSLIDSRPGRPTLVTADVPQHRGTTTTAPPEVVGIPILPQLPLLRVINKTRTSLDRARKASRNREACPILQLRSLHAFGLSPLDYVTSGVLIPPPSLRPHQVAINNAYRHAFRLPPWAHSAFLHLPLQQGGPGAPLLAYRAPLNLLRTYLRASWGPNTLAVAATASLVSPRRPTPWLTEGPALAQALAPLDITVHLLPSPRVRPAPQHHTGSLAPLRSLPYVVVACDGSQEGTRLGAGFLLWHPLHGTLYRGWLGLHALAGHSTDAEWIAKIAAMFTLRGWSGAALFASDSTASQLCDLTRGPPPSSALSIPYRAALLSASFRMHEAWLPAQHDSGSASLLATLNAEADSLAPAGSTPPPRGPSPGPHSSTAASWRSMRARSSLTPHAPQRQRMRPPPPAPTHSTFGPCPQAGPPTYSASRMNAPRSRRWPSTASCTSGYFTPRTTPPATEA